jgi:multiple sugar transport system substrate-binding protein
MAKTIALAIALPVLVAAVGFAGGRHETFKTVHSVSDSGVDFNWRASSGATIEVMLDSHPWQKFIQPFVPEFEKQTGIQVDLKVYPENQFRTKRTVEMVSGTSSIDAYMIMPAEDLAKYTQSGWLEPLNAYMKSKSISWPEYDITDFFHSALEAGVKNGKNYTIPIQLETSLLAYNKRILARYHVGVPATMAELLAAAKRIYDASGGKIYGITLRGDKAAATSQWIDFVHSYGGAWLNSAGKAAIDSPQAVAATELYGKLLRLYGPKSAPTNSWYDSVSIFMQGRAAMIYDANVFKADYENKAASQVAGHVGYTIIPRGPAGSIPHVSAWSLGIYSGSHHKVAAWLFIQWATGKEMDLRALIDGIPVARDSAWNSPVFKKNDTSPEWTRATLASYKVASPLWNPPVIPVRQCREATGEAIVTAILGGNVAKALRNAAAQMNEIISSSR